MRNSSQPCNEGWLIYYKGYWYGEIDGQAALAMGNSFKYLEEAKTHAKKLIRQKGDPEFQTAQVVKVHLGVKITEYTTWGYSDEWENSEPL